MFWKIGFFVELMAIVAMALIFMKASPIKNEGAASWVDVYSKDPAATVKFLEGAFGIEIAAQDDDPEEGADWADYTLVKAAGQMWPFAGVTGLPAKDAAPHSTPYLTVKDYAAAHMKMIDAGATVVFADKYAGGARFGVYAVPGGVDIGIVQWEHAEKK